jgi:hypothetical protein|tara:strand:- start:3016 stop:4311 length:1296 start_codon:yes stop_codon:yes gene_type:complete
MGKIKKKISIGIAAVAAIMIVIGLTSVFSQQFTAFSEVLDKPVRIPVYTNVACDSCPNVIEDNIVASTTEINALTYALNKDLANFDKATCGNVLTDSYLPKGCDIDIDSDASTIFAKQVVVYKCDDNVLETSVKDALKKISLAYTINQHNAVIAVEGCQIEVFDRDISNRVTIAQDNVVYVASLSGYRIRVREQPFCLRINTFDGRQDIISNKNACNVFTIKNGVGEKGFFDGIKEKNFESKYGTNLKSGLLKIGSQNAIENIVAAYSDFVNPVDIVQHPKTGEAVFLRFSFKAIDACQIKEGVDGILYVDTLNGCKEDSNFICVPSVQGKRCVGGTKLQEGVTGQDCVGTDKVIGFQQIPEKNLNCEVKCIRNKIKVTTNCGKIKDTIVEPKDIGEVQRQVPKLFWPIIILISGTLLAIAAGIAIKKFKK